jgi:hypothetical protein
MKYTSRRCKYRSIWVIMHIIKECVSEFFLVLSGALSVYKALHMYFPVLSDLSVSDH